MHKDLPKNTLCFAIFSFQSYSTNVKLALKSIRMVSRRIPRFWSGRRCGPSKLVIGIQKNGGLDELAPGGRRKAVAFLMGKVLLLARTEELNDRLACRWLGISGPLITAKAGQKQNSGIPCSFGAGRGPWAPGSENLSVPPYTATVSWTGRFGGLRQPAGQW